MRRSQTVQKSAPLIGQVERFVFESPSMMWVAGVLAVLIVEDGISRQATWQGLFRARTFPHGNGDPSTDYLLGSPLDLGLAHWAGLTTDRLFFAEHLLGLVAFVALLAFGAWRRRGRFGLAIALLVFLAGPLSNIEMTWIGLSDPFTLIFLTMSVVFDSIALALIAGIGLGLSHAEVGWLGFIGLVAVDAYRKRVGAAVAVVIGLIFGTAATIAVDVYGGVGVDPRGTFIRQIGIAHLVTRWVGHLPALVFSFFGALWLAIIWLAPVWAPDRRSLTTAVGLVLLGAAVSIFTLDETRVFALVVWAPVLWIALRIPEDPRVMRAMAWTFVAAVVIPHVYVLNGQREV